MCTECKTEATVASNVFLSAIALMGVIFVSWRFSWRPMLKSIEDSAKQFLARLFSMPIILKLIEKMKDKMNSLSENNALYGGLLRALISFAQVEKELLC